MENNKVRAVRKDKGVKRAPLPESTRQKISEACQGRIPHNKGKKEAVKHVYYTDGAKKGKT